MAHDVFISYDTDDRETAERVRAALEADQIRCWIAPRDIPPGAPYEEAIVDAISTSPVLVLVLSANSNRSEHVLNEIRCAFAEGSPTKVIPLRVEEVNYSKRLFYYLGSVQWVDAAEPPLEGHLGRLVNYVRARLPAPAPPPTPVSNVVPDKMKEDVPSPPGPVKVEEDERDEGERKSPPPRRAVVVAAALLGVVIAAWIASAVFRQTDEQANTNTNANTNPTNVNIVVPDVSVTPTPTATPTPSETPTPTPIPTPTRRPTATPSPVRRPTPAPTPTAEPTPVVNPTPVVTPTPVAARTPSATRTPTLVSSDDAMMMLSLNGALQSHEGLTSVRASVAGGRVTLTGYVNAEHLKRTAEDVCRRAGARGRIVNRVMLRP